MSVPFPTVQYHAAETSLSASAPIHQPPDRKIFAQIQSVCRRILQQLNRITIFCRRHCLIQRRILHITDLRHSPRRKRRHRSMAQIMTTVRISEMIFCFIFFILSLLLLLPGYSHLFYLRNPPGGGSRPGTFKDGSCRRADISYYFNYFSQAQSAVRRFRSHTAHAIRRIPPPAKPAVPGPPVSTPSTGSAQAKPNSPSSPV